MTRTHDSNNFPDTLILQHSCFPQVHQEKCAPFHPSAGKNSEDPGTPYASRNKQGVCEQCYFRERSNTKAAEITRWQSQKCHMPKNWSQRCECGIMQGMRKACRSLEDVMLGISCVTQAQHQHHSHRDMEVVENPKTWGLCVWGSRNLPGNKRLPESGCSVGDEKTETSEKHLCFMEITLI